MKKTTLLIGACIFAAALLYTAAAHCQEEDGPLFPVEEDGKWGYIDKNGKLAIKPQFDSAVPFSESLASVKTDNKYGFIDKTGKTVIEANYDAAESFSEGLAVVKIDKKYSYIDKTGKLAIEAKYDGAYSFTEGLAAVKEGDKWGYIDKKGKAVIKPQFKKARSFHNGLALVSEGGRKGYINTEGKYVWREPEKKEKANATAAESHAISMLRTLCSAQAIYVTRYGTYATMKQLADKNYIDKKLASGKKDGYYFDIDSPTESTWSAVAWPEKPGKTGTRSFYVSEDGVIYEKRCTSAKDSLADKKNSKPLGSR